MKRETYYNDIQKAFENLPENFNILEEKIDIEVQMQYIEYSKSVDKDRNLDELFEKGDELFIDETSTERKKEILSGLAVVEDVAAYRTIEKFVENSEGFLKQWGILALQESRMLLQSLFLDEQQVFISTGLGGKGKKLRYFVVFVNRENKILTKTQRKLLKDELIFELKKYEGEFELIDYMEGFSTTQVMLPLKTDIREIFKNVITECNQYGDFLREDMIVTNVKALSKGEIIQMLDKKDENEELEEE